MKPRLASTLRKSELKVVMAAPWRPHFSFGIILSYQVYRIRAGGLSGIASDSTGDGYARDRTDERHLARRHRRSRDRDRRRDRDGFRAERDPSLRHRPAGTAA